VIFFIHVFVAAYCIACGVLDAYGHFRSWLIPNIAVFYCLLASALILPVMAAVCIVGSQLKHPVILIFTHMVMGASQVFFGLLPLFS